MRLALAAIIASAAALVGAAPRPRQSLICPEATQYGIVTISPTTVSPGEILTVNANFTCAIEYFGNIPEFTDYYIEVTVNNNGHEPPILLSRRNAPGTNTDSFTVTVPIANYFANTSYSVVLETTYPVDGPTGMPYSVVGGIETPITINV